MDAEMIVGNLLIKFDISGHKLSVRQPTAVEYDLALLTEQRKRAEFSLDENFSKFASAPCSPAEREMLTRLHEMSIEDANNLDDADAKREALERAESYKRAIENRTMADELASDSAVLARDYFLAIRLLCTEDGEQIFDPQDAESVKDFDQIWVLHRESIRPRIWEAIRLIAEAPLDWGRILKPRSSRRNGSGSPRRSS